MKSRILQIGWRPKGSRALQKLGYEVDVVASLDQIRDGLDERQWADQVFPTESFQQFEALYYAILRQTDTTKYAAVIGFDEYTLLPASLIARAMKLPFRDPKMIARMRDKSLQKQLARAAGLNCAKTMVFENVGETINPGMPYPFVLKPVAGAGTNCTFIIRSAEDFNQAKLKIAHGPKRTFVAESFVEGREHHFDGYVQNGEIVFLDIGRYLNNVIEIQTGGLCGSVSISAQYHPEFYATARVWIASVLQALDYTDGVFHIEGFWNAHGWTFSEAAMRNGGGGIALQVETTYGIDLFEVQACFELGLSIPKPNTGGGQSQIGWVYLSSPAGILRAFPDEEQIQTRNGGLPLEISLPVGTKMPERSENSVIRIGLTMLQAPTLGEVERSAREMADWFYNHVEVEALK